MNTDFSGASTNRPFDGGGETGAMIRVHDWSASPLGPPAGWPVALRTLVDVLTGSAQPMFVVWGADRTLLYNDAYSEILASKHPSAFGRNFLEVWHEIEQDLVPIVEQVMRGEPVRNDDIGLWMERKGFREETHFAFSYTPVHGEGGPIEGFFCACQEITNQIMADRRARRNAERVQLALGAGAIIGTWFWHLPTDRFTVDQAFAEAFGIDPALGREGLSLEQVIATVHPDDKPGLAAAIEEVIGRGGHYAHQYRVRRADGNYYWIEANGRVDMAEDGTPLHFPGVLLDVEVRRATERKLRETSARLDAILNNTREAVFLMDDRQHCVFANLAAEILTGYNFEQLSAQPLHDVIHCKKPDGSHYPLEECPIDRAFPERAQMSGEELFVAPDGSFYPVAFTASPLLDDKGQPIGTVIEARNIAEEKAKTETLRRNEARLRFLSELDDALRSAPDAAGAMSAASHLLGRELEASRCAYASVEADNDTFTILDEYTAPGQSSSVGRYSLDLFGPRAAADMRGGGTLVIRHVTAELAAGEGRETFRAIDIEAVVCCPLIKDGRLVAMMAVHQNQPRDWSEDDIGLIQTVVERCWAHVERVTAEARLREETRTLETLNTVGKALVGELDLNRLVQMVTDASVELIGADYGAFFYNVAQNGGESLMLYTLSGAERSDFEQFGMPGLTEVFAPTFTAHQIVRSEDILADPRFGKNAPHNGLPQGHLPVRSYLAVPVLSRSGEAIGGLFFAHKETGRFTERHERLVAGLAAQGAVAIDNARLFQSAHDEIEERHRVEEQLRYLNDTLEQRVAEEIAARGKAEEALRQAQKMEAVGQLTGGIAHDFNNLLTVVTGNIDMAGRALAKSGTPDARAQRALDNALKGAERAAALTQRLLAFSRRQPLTPKALDPDRLVSGMSDLLQRALGERVKLEVVTSPGLWRVEADPNQLESAILNLAVNARDAMPDGGTLTVETANARLDEEYAAEHAEVAPGHYVVIAVNDTGTGMSKETAARVFEPFFTTKEVGKGTGLGLSMVYGFTKQSGGHVKIYSEQGHGTTVKLYLPRLLADIEAAEPEADAGLEVSRSQELILVVEDDDDVRSYTVECLRELGYRVREAHDGEAALRIFERGDETIDLLFTDVVMPGMTGRELADRVRQEHPQVKVLFTSGYTRDAITHGGRLDEGVEMISKPFTYTSLARKIADVLDKGQTGRVLLVEQDATLRMFAAEGLVEGGYQVDEALTPAEALARVRAARGRYDAVLLDERLAGHSGEALAAELRKLYADLPILMASDQPESLARRFDGDRCMDVIGKPYAAAKLLRALNDLGVRCRRKAADDSEDSN